MLHHNRWLLTVLIVSFAGVLLVFTPAGYYPRQAPRVDPVAVYERIRLGDTAQQVESLIGLPPGDYRTRPDVGYTIQEVGIIVPSSRELSWSFDGYQVVVCLDEDGIVVDKQIGSGVVFRKTFLEWLQEQLRSVLRFWGNPS